MTWQMNKYQPTEGSKTMDNRIDPRGAPTCGACGFSHAPVTTCASAATLRSMARATAKATASPQANAHPPQSYDPSDYAGPPGYECLAEVLERAFHQAARGKGAERHADSKPFDDQPMQHIARRRGIGFILGQADKKSEEAQGMFQRGEKAKAVHELLGAIVYLAGAIIYIESEHDK